MEPHPPRELYLQAAVTTTKIILEYSDHDGDSGGVRRRCTGTGDAPLWKVPQTYSCFELAWVSGALATSGGRNSI